MDHFPMGMVLFCCTKFIGGLVAVSFFGDYANQEVQEYVEKFNLVGWRESKNIMKGKNKMRKYTDRIRFWVTPEQRKMIEERMRKCGIINLSGYCRLMAINGYFIKLDTSDLKEVVRLMCIFRSSGKLIPLQTVSSFPPVR